MAEETTITPSDIELERARWMNRRLMAYISLGAIIVLIQEMIFVSFFLTDGTLEAVSSIITTGIFVLGSLVAAYMGLATFSEAGFWQRKK